jgi:hypothetical protein
MSEKIARQRISIAMSHISAGSASAGSTQRDAVTVADRDAVIVACARTPIGTSRRPFNQRPVQPLIRLFPLSLQALSMAFLRHWPLPSWVPLPFASA